MKKTPDPVSKLQRVLGAQLFEGFLETGNHAFLTLSEPYTRVIVLLVGSVFALRVAL